MATYGWISATQFKVPHLESNSLKYDDEGTAIDVKEQINKLENAAGLEDNGTYSANNGTTYLKTVDSLKAADEALDAQVKNTRDGAGLVEANGSLGDWATNNNYLTADKTTLKAGIEALDAQLRLTQEDVDQNEADADAAIQNEEARAKAAEQANTNNIQSNDTELDNLRATAGVGAANNFTWSTNNNYLTADKTTLKAGIEALDLQLRATQEDVNQNESDADAAIQNEEDRAKNAEQTNATNIATNATAIATETTDRQSAVSSLESLVQARSAGLDPKESVAVSSSDTLADGQEWVVGNVGNNGLSVTTKPPIKAENGRRYVEMPQPNDSNGAVASIKIWEEDPNDASKKATRVLLRHQASNSKENGIYNLVKCVNGNQTYWCLQRTKDFNGKADAGYDSSEKDITPGAFTFVESGEHKNQGFVVQSAAFTSAGVDHASSTANSEKLDIHVEFVKFSGVDARDIDGVSLEYNANNVVAIKADGVTEVHLNSTANQEAVVTEVIRNSAVTTDKIKDAAVTTAKIAALNITTGLIAAKAVTTEKIDDDAVTNAQLADNSVNTEQIQNNAVENAKIKDNAVTHQKIDLASAQMKLTAEGLGFTGDQSTALGDLGAGEMKLVKRTVPAGQDGAGTYLSVVHKDAAGNALYYTNLAPIQA